MLAFSEKYPKVKSFLTAAAPFGWFGLLAFALWMLGREWGGFHLSELDEALRRIGGFHLAIALILTAASLFCNACLDLVALRWLGKTLPRGKVIGTALIASSFSMNGGGTILGGGTIRMRFYGQYGLGPSDIASITAFLLVAGWLGHALLAGIMMVWAPPDVASLSPAAGRGIGLALLATCLVTCVLATTGFRGKPVRFLPGPRLVVAAMFISALDWLFAGLALRVFLPAEVPTPAFLAATAIGQAIGAASHLPGGLGVMELFITRLAGNMAPGPVIVGALLTYRITYYLIPFVIAVAAVSTREVWNKRHWVKKTVNGTGKAWSAIAPRLAAMSTLAGGFILMLSANTPIEADRRILVAQFVPLPFVEASHFLASIGGTLMIIVASGLLRRVQAAWWAAVLMAGSGIVFSLLKGFDWEEALVLSVFLAALLPFRSKFHRHAAIWTRRFSPQWWGLVLSVVGLAVWFGFYTSRHTGYENQLWWQVSFENDAARLLRGTAGSAAILLAVALIQWFRPAPPRTRKQPPSPDLIAGMVAATSRCSAALALVGDKEFLFNYDQSAFLMYSDHARTRVALADPVGDESKFEGLYWRFVEQARDEGMRVAIYQVSAAMMPVCVEMGLRIYKLGEEAMIPLDTFDLSSSELKKFRKVMNRMERGGWVFEIWPPEIVSKRLGELRAVSEAWLAHHNAREKGFSLGRFNDHYISMLPVAVILIGGQVVAFGNLWPGNGRDELSTDLMRHTPDAPNGVMDCLFVSLMLWGKSKGYRWFDLGMAPLSGLAANSFAPLWSRIGGLIYDKGEAFYNFNGLRAWKSKFQPVWHPRYLAISNAWDLPAAILDITKLIGKPTIQKRRPPVAGTSTPSASDSP